MNSPEVDSKVQHLYSVFRRRHLIEQMLRLYSFSGVLIALLGTGYFISTLTLKEDQLTALSLAAGGLILALLAWAAARFMRTRFDRDRLWQMEAEASLEVLTLWRVLEDVSRSALSEKSTEFDRLSYRSIIKKLQEQQLLQAEDVSDLEGALQLRNMLAHGRGPAPLSVSEDVLRKLRSVIAKIRMASRSG